MGSAISGRGLLRYACESACKSNPRSAGIMLWGGGPEFLDTTAASNVREHTPKTSPQRTGWGILLWHLLGIFIRYRHSRY